MKEKRIIKRIFQLLLLPLFLQAQSPGQLTIQECYALAKENYPLSQRYDLIAKTAEYNIDNIGKGYLPRLKINGQATYQSEVTKIPLELPGMDIPSLSKDQYKVYAELDQLIYDGGINRHRKKLEEAGEQVETQKLEAELYKLRERINHLFFGILLIEEQLKQNELLIKDIRLGIKKTEAAVDNGAALKSDLYVLKSNLLRTGQKKTELQAARNAYMKMLGMFIHRDIDEQTNFVKPQAADLSQDINRPETGIYDRQIRNLDIRHELLTAGALPKLSLFVQGGAGRPALNMLSNDFEMYYLGGVRLTWTPSVFYTMKKERSLIDLHRRNLEVQKNTFLFNINMDIAQQSAEIIKYQKLLESDDQIIQMQEEIKNTALAQLNNGLIDANDYMRDVNAENQARQSKIVHEIRLLMAQYDQQTTRGKPSVGEDD